MKRSATAAGLVLLLLGCNAQQDESEGARASASGAPDPAAFASPPDFPLPFSTRVPAGMDVSSSTGSDRPVVRFESTQTPGAFVHLFAHPAGRSEDGAEEVVRAIADSYGPIRQFDEVQPISGPSWANVAYELSGEKAGGGPFGGFVALGRKGDRWFHVLVQYPRSEEGRFRPLAQQVLADWRWSDTGEPLEASRAIAPRVDGGAR